MEEFYLKNMAILIQGILKGYSQSISAIAEHSLIKIHRTTLSRFLNEHDEFWKEMKKRFQVLLFDKGEKTLVVDETHLERKWSSSAISYMRFLCKDISNSDYARLNEYVNSFTMSFGLST